MNWYVVHTHSGYEEKACQSLRDLIQHEGLEDLFGQVVAPPKIIVKRGWLGRLLLGHTHHQGFILVEVSLTDETRRLVESTPKITGLVGGSRTPQAIPEGEVKKLLQRTNPAEGDEDCQVPSLRISVERVKRDDRPGPGRTSLWRILIVFAVMGWVATSAGYLGRCWWLLELASHFRIQYLLGLLPLAIAFLIGKRYVLGAVTALFGLLNALCLPGLYLEGPAPDGAGRKLRLLLLNVHTSNARHDAVLDLLREEDPDLIVLLEIDARWAQALSALRERYPHFAERPRPDNFGIAAYSRIATRSMRFEDIGADVPSIVAELDADGAPATVIGTHTMPPVSAWNAAQRNQQLEALAGRAREIRGPAILLGDLNASSWSPFFGDLIDASGLRDSREGFGVQASWPDGLLLLMVPIDHCLVSKGVGVLDRRVGPSVGSDHRPIVVDVVLPASI
ncbi:MAG: endonuclease/exonuclease/phosphatase family protein [Deltaproteobacteria bacterium]|nr:endonuclease/exonuclease/phosphatase family protein [Deltaproteobacteria bacterium]